MVIRPNAFHFNKLSIGWSVKGEKACSAYLGGSARGKDFSLGRFARGRGERRER
jgi:hypothetical protein